MIPFTYVLLALIALLLVCDYVSFDRMHRNLLKLEIFAFAACGVLVVVPDATTSLAHALGIGRGVDLVSYPLIILLVRESLVNRQRAWMDEQRMTELVRSLALTTARRWEHQDSQDKGSQLV